MNQDDKMHPDDKRNLIIFGALSILLWLGYDHFILGPKMDQLNAARQAAYEQALSQQQESGLLEHVEVPRDQAIESADVPRISIENDLIKGSLNPVGARFDDLVTKNHFKTTAREEPAVILSPRNSPFPKYIEHGWLSNDKVIKTPQADTRWRVSEGDSLSENSNVILQWNNGQGLTFRKEISLDEAYGFNIKKSIVNNSGKDITFFPYALIAERGTPEDFEGRFVVHEGPISYVDEELYEATYGDMEDKPRYQRTGTGGWVGLTTKNWLTALAPKQDVVTKFQVNYTQAINQNSKDLYQVDTLGPGILSKSGSTIIYEEKFFAGAKKLDIINQYEKEWSLPRFNLVIDWGWFFFLTKPFFYIINFFYGLVGNFGIAIILFTICLRIVVFPLANTSFKSFANMRKIAPRMAELRDQYRDDKVAMQQELVKLYQKEKVNPMAGCLPIMIQIPIFFSLFKVLSNTIEMRHAPFFGWIEDLSAPDPTSVFNLFGLLPFTPPDFLMIGIWPCLMLVTMLFQRTLSPPPTDKMQARMIGAMPWVMTFILAQFAAGLVIYWTFNNILSAIQQYIIMTHMGVKVDIIGNILGKNKNKEEGAEGEVVESSESEDAAKESAPQKEEKPVKVSKPKPKKSKKKK
ncbi:MAG: membrane protein insertase YidC [Pseudomonadota bacterium]